MADLNDIILLQMVGTSALTNSTKSVETNEFQPNFFTWLIGAIVITMISTVLIVYREELKISIMKQQSLCKYVPVPNVRFLIPSLVRDEEDDPDVIISRLKEEIKDLKLENRELKL